MFKSSIEAILLKDEMIAVFFQGVYPGKKWFEPELPPRISSFPSCFVVNTGGHFVGLYFPEDGVCEFMDSFGRHLDHPYFDDYLREFARSNSTRVICNNRCLQTKYSSVCGVYVAIFLRLRVRGISMDRFADLLWAPRVPNGNILTDLLMYYISHKVYHVELERLLPFEQAVDVYSKKLQYPCRGLLGYTPERLTKNELEKLGAFSSDLKLLLRLQSLTTKELIKLKHHLKDCNSFSLDFMWPSVSCDSCRSRLTCNLGLEDQFPITAVFTTTSLEYVSSASMEPLVNSAPNSLEHCPRVLTPNLKPCGVFADGAGLPLDRNS